MKLQIREKFILSSLAICTISAGFFGWFSIQHEKKTLEKELKERIISLTDNLATNSIYGVLTLNKEELNKLATNTLAQKDIVYVSIEDKTGKVLVELEKAGREGENLEEFTEPILAEKMQPKSEEILLELEEKSGEKEEIGKVRIKFSLESLNSKIKDLIRAVFLVALIIIVFVSITGSILVEKYISIPIKRLIEATYKISKGDLDHRVSIKTRDEIGELTVFFNKMTEELKKSREQIEEHSRLLEQKVEERTRELKESHAPLIQISKMAAVGQLAGGVAHELNNPIGVILGFAQLVAKDLKEDNPLYMPLKSIEREAIRCKKLISDLLTFSRVGKTEKEKADINELIEQTLSLISAQAKVKGVEIIKEYGENLPQIMVNKNQIQQVIINLCNNAIDAMPEGGKLTIKTESPSYPPFSKEEEVGFIEITVSDTGIGMSEEVKKRIFEPFFTTKEVGKGTGLGLSLVYEIVQKHNGKIEVESEVGKGTTFKIMLPV
ncbi:MAG: ATP-binding protein [Endomicrobiia bacterium]